MNRNVPKLRFKGFTEDWEQRKLDSLAKFTKGAGYSKGDLVDSGTPIILYGRLYTNYETTIRNVDTFVVEKENSVFSRGGEVIVPASGETAEDIARASAVENAGVLLGGDLNIIEPDKSVNSSFLALTISNGNPQKELAKKAQGKSVVHIRNDEIKRLLISLPNRLEQDKISNYFDSLDNLITLHQRKCDSLKEYKKGMLQKMFPKAGEKVPEIRFPGFTEDWEQCNFLDGVSEIGDGLHGTPIYCDTGNVYFINGNNLVDGKVVITSETKTVDKTQQSVTDKSLDNNTILMSINGTIGNLAYYSGENLMLGKSTAYIKVSHYDKKFVYAYLQAPSVHIYFMNNLTGTTIKNLGLKAIREMKLLVPSNVEEQKKVGEYFTYLDHLITLHQRKCEKIKELKKGLLQQMFV